MTISWLDPIGACLGLICTYYFTKANRFAWILGLITISINAVLYFQKGIYGRVGLEGLYFISMIYGLYHWGRAPSQQKERPIRSLGLQESLGYSLLALTAIWGLATCLQHYTQSNVPYWDATTTILCLLAQWLLCRKVIESWILWFFVDAMVALLECYKGIPFHSAVHWLYLGMAVMGYIRWSKMFREQKPLILQPA